MLIYLVQGLGLAFPAMAQPGPLQAYIITQTLQAGWQRTLPAALAPLLSDGPIILLVWLALRHMPPWLVDALRVVGGLFLLYLAWQAWRRYRRPTLPGTSSPVGHQSLWRATLVNLLNPNPYVFWATVAGPLLLAHWQERPVFGLLFLVGFYSTMVGGLALLILAAGAAGGTQGGGRFGRLLTPLSILLLLFFGLYQLAAVALNH